MKYGILFLAVFVLVKPIVPLVEYAVNFEYISEVLCLNRDKPQMACNGKCHLKNTLEKEFEGDKSANSNKSHSEKENSPVYFERLFSYECQFPEEARAGRNVFYVFLYRFSTTGSIFHPPQYS